MPDQRHHRGPHPEDARLFAPARHEALCLAVAEFSWLLSRGYAEPSALKLVGDRYDLTARQRTAIMRCSCSDDSLRSRLSRQLPAEALAGQELLIDGYNVLTTVEAALGGGAILIGRDTCFRDMASIHGTYRKVEETLPALELVGRALAGLGTARSVWYLDKPVSNSGRLAEAIRLAATAESRWTVEIVADPDPVLAASPQIIATADSVVLDRCGPWFSLARQVVSRFVPDAWLVDLSG